MSGFTFKGAVKTCWKAAANMNKMKTCWSVREYFCSQLYFFLWIAWGQNLIPNFLNFCPFCQREGTPKLIYVTTATTGAGVLFQDVALFWQISGTQGAPHCIIAFFNIDAMLRPELAPPASPCNKIETVFPLMSNINNMSCNLCDFAYWLGNSNKACLNQFTKSFSKSMFLMLTLTDTEILSRYCFSLKRE